MSAIGTLVRTLRPADLFAWPVMAGTAIDFAVVQIVSPYNTPGTALPRAAIQLVAVFTAFVFLFVVYQLCRRIFSEGTLRLILLASIPVAAVLGGAVLGWVLVRAGLDPESLWSFRIFVAFVHITALTAVLWAAVSGIRLHYARLADLLEERDQLEKVEFQTRQSLAALDEEATEAVRSRIMQGLPQLATAQAQQVLEQLTMTIELIVRPLSRQLEAQSETWIPPVRTRKRDYRIDWRRAAVDGMAPGLFRPLPVMAILALIATPMNVGRSGLVFEFEFLAVAFLVAVPLFCLIRRGAVRIAGTAPGPRRVTTFVAMGLLCGFALAVVLLPFTFGDPQPLRFFRAAPVFSLIVVFVWGVAVAAQRQAGDTEAKLIQATSDLSWRIARARELHRQHRRALAHAVHGQIQAALAAGILQLEAALKDGSANEALVGDVRSRIVACVEELDLRNVQPSPVRDVIRKVEATWSGVVQVQLTIDHQTEVSLESDVQCLTSINDLIPELVFNSIKHGKATRIEVSITRPDWRTQILVVTDDGRSLTEFVSGGMGSRLLDESSIEWHRKRQGHSTVTSATLAFAPFVQDGQFAAVIKS